ncbi:MAG: MliC family protein [Gemmatimonadales bacterium]
MRWTFGVMLVLASSCGGSRAARTLPIAFVCPAGDTIRTRFWTDSAAVLLPGTAAPVTLPRAVSGSGARYSDGSLTFWNKGDSAFVMLGDSIVIRDCGRTL